MELFDSLWPGLARPLLRLVIAMSAGILIANTLEALAWERRLARLAAPLVRLSRMGESSAAAFVTSFFSAQAASAILSAAYAEGGISKKELMLANIFNSFPAYLVHLPNVAAVAVALLGKWGVIYLALGLSAALARTLGTALAGHFMLPGAECPDCIMPEERRPDFSEVIGKIFGSFKRRLLRVLKFTLPIYILFFFTQRWGGFDAAQRFMSEHASFLPFLNPEALSLAALNFTAETSASMSAAAALLHSGTISGRDIVLALLAGNILSSPVRAVRHQLPSYAGYFPVGAAALLVLCNQGVRAASLIMIFALYYFF